MEGSFIPRARPRAAPHLRPRARLPPRAASPDRNVNERSKFSGWRPQRQSERRERVQEQGGAASPRRRRRPTVGGHAGGTKSPPASAVGASGYAARAVGRLDELL